MPILHKLVLWANKRWQHHTNKLTKTPEEFGQLSEFQKLKQGVRFVRALPYATFICIVCERKGLWDLVTK